MIYKIIFVTTLKYISSHALFNQSLIFLIFASFPFFFFFFAIMDSTAVNARVPNSLHIADEFMKLIFKDLQKFKVFLKYCYLERCYHLCFPSHFKMRMSVLVNPMYYHFYMFNDCGNTILVCILISLITAETEHLFIGYF